MAKARVPVIADQKVIARCIAASMETAARKVIVARKAVVLKATAAPTLVAPTLVAPKANVVIPSALIDLVVRVKTAVRNVIVNSREMVKSCATGNDTLTRSLTNSQQGPPEIIRTGPCRFVFQSELVQEHGRGY